MIQPIFDAKHIDKDPDIVQLVLNACLEAGFPEAKAQQIRQEICQKYGGRRIYVPKRKQHLAMSRKAEMLAAMKRLPVKDVIAEYDIGKTTAYRVLKTTQ